MGSQRIVSKIGDLESFGADPRRVVYAGHDVDGIDEVDFAGKYQTATGNIKERYQSFDLEYKGEENNDYVNGQGFCCTDNPLGRDGARTVSDTKDGETPERLIYFYHSDHLGSSSLITNFDGEVTQHVEYIPYGEVFIEERNNVWNTPYLFNAKELDEETGLYYYGARYLNPMDAMWLSVDPLAELYPGMSSYNYCMGNPVKYIDPFGLSSEESDGNMLPEVVVTAPKNSPQSNQPDINVGPINQWQWNMQVKNTEFANKSTQASTDWKPYAGAGATVVQEMYYSKTYGTWMGKNFKMYKQTWGGNKYTGGKNKFGKKMSGGMEWIGKGIGMWSAWNVLDSWIKDEISTGWMITEEISNVISMRGGLEGAAWGIGWELGRTITNTEWYQEFKFNVMYDYWERKFGSPCESNEYLWIYFFENYK